MSGTGPSPLSLPVLGGAALLSSPALWAALAEGTMTTETALIRYLVSVVICWAGLAFVAMLVGPLPHREAAESTEPESAEPEPAESRPAAVS